MNRKVLMVVILFLLIIKAYSIELSLEVTGIRNTKGHIRVAVFTDEVQFRKEQPLNSIIFDKSQLIDNKMDELIVNLNPGIYGIAVLDDENDNGKLDYKLIIPCEGIGFSCFEHKLRKPDFDDFSFELKDGFPRKLKIRIKYIL
jgi:uncharacterized protein (DUF2141 family)